MKLSFQSAASKRAFQHLKLCGVPRDVAVGIMLTIKNWEHNNGTEWVVNRLKSLKTAFIQNLSGSDQVTVPWIAFKNQSGRQVPKGPIGVLWRTLDSEKLNAKKIVKALSALMVYTSYKSGEVTQKQYIKTVGAIRSTDVLSNEIQVKLESLGEQISNSLLGTKRLSWSFHPAGLNTGKPGTWSQFKYLESFLMGLNVPYVGAYLEKKGNLPSCLAAPLWGSDEDMMSPGEISIIQERGFKPRVVAMPHASVQVALYPLHRLLDGILRYEMNTDCTHNQEEGARFAQEALKKGLPVYSVDLSGATDNFPRSFQIGVLRGLGLRDEAVLIDQLSSLQWKLSHDLKQVAGEKFVVYTKGQPQGMYASFPLFGLSHNLLCHWMCKKLNIDPLCSFRVLGDDIVIASTELHDMYRKYMKEMKVPISEDKSLQSNKIAEFAGYVISAEGYWKPAKVPNNSAALSENFVNYLKVVGHQGLPQLRGQVRRIARLVAELPEELGGLGLNPHGLSKADRSLNLADSERLIAIPKYFGIHASLPAAKYDYFLQEGEVFLNWLNDQFSLFDVRLKSMLDTLDWKYQLSNYTEPRALVYQLSMLQDVEGKPYMASFVGSLDKAIEQHAFVSDFQKWKNILQKASRSSYYKYHDKKSHDNIKMTIEKWGI